MPSKFGLKHIACLATTLTLVAGSLSLLLEMEWIRTALRTRFSRGNLDACGQPTPQVCEYNGGGNRSSPRFAYVTYVAHTKYMKGAVVVFKALRALGSDREMVVLHSRPLSAHWRRKFCLLGVRTRYWPKYKKKQRGYYEHCMLKLSVFLLTEYNRLVYIEAANVRNIEKALLQ